MSDDHPRKFDRRQALAAFGAVSLSGVLAACGGDDGGSGTTAVTTEDGTTATVAPKTGSSASGLFDDSASCSVTPQETEGPYYFDVDSIRSDIREDRDGTPLRLAIRVRSAGGDCAPVENAVVDIWHCDALGAYSGFESASQGGAPGGGRTDDETYLRGAQVTNKDGIVEFRTIYPGFYRGRTTHIHAKVHVDRQTVLTSQLYFDDDLTAKVYAGEPYSQAGERDTFNDSDGIFDERLVTTTKRDGDGYLALMTFDVQQA